MSAAAEPRVRARPMRQDDVPAVMAIELAAYPFPWTAGIFRDCLKSGYHGLVLERGQQLIGYAMLSVAVDEGHLLNLCIDPAQQGCGHGRHLLGEVIALARRFGVETLFLEVRPSNPHAIALYRSVGFCEVGVRRGYYPAARGREDALVMALTLLPEDGGFRP